MLISVIGAIILISARSCFKSSQSRRQEVTGWREYVLLSSSELEWLVPLNLIALIVKAFVTEAGVFFLLTVIVLSLVMILTIIASIVSLIKIYRWLRESESKDSKEESLDHRPLDNNSLPWSDPDRRDRSSRNLFDNRSSHLGLYVLLPRKWLSEISSDATVVNKILI